MPPSPSTTSRSRTSNCHTCRSGPGSTGTPLLSAAAGARSTQVARTIFDNSLCCDASRAPRRPAALLSTPSDRGLRRDAAAGNQPGGKSSAAQRAIPARFVTGGSGVSARPIDGRVLVEGLGTHVREQQHVADRWGVGKKHDEPVDADADAGCRRHAVFERADVVVIE